jgi:ABC1 atypical kinase-like domain
MYLFQKSFRYMLDKSTSQCFSYMFLLSLTYYNNKQSTEKVLIMEYMDGIRLNDKDSLEAYGVDKQKLVEEITRAYAHQIYVDGFFNGDPHPGIRLLTYY